jgi:3-oxoadipate enol-lactonase
MHNGTATSNRFINSVRAGPRGGAPVILLHAVGLDLTYWDAQFGCLSKRHDVLAFDWPGHGRSSVFDGGISFDDLSEVVASVVKEAANGPAHIVGLSMGSMVAQYFALTHPELIQSLCLIGSACTLSDPVRQALRDRAASAHRGGMSAVLKSATGHWFTPKFRGERPDVIDRAEKTVLACDPKQYAAYWEMIAGLDTQKRLAELNCPTLVLVGEQDSSTPPAAAQLIGEQIPGARVKVIAGASHMVQLEAPEVVNKLVDVFLRDRTLT